MKAVLLNVSELPPPEPMIEILSALANLPKEHYLKIFHSRIPYPLFARLTENHWAYQYDQDPTQSGITLYIYRQSEQQRFIALNLSNNIGEAP
jgi:uncharacterized protein (DUF2249 family)